MTSPPQGRWRLWLQRLGLAGAPAGFALAYFLQGAGQDASPVVTWLAIGGGTILTFAAGLAAHWDARRQGRKAIDAVQVARSARLEATQPLNAVIAPALQSLQDIVEAVDAADCQVKKERLKQLVVILSLKLGTSTRGCYFELTVEQTRTGPVRVLRCDGPHGLWQGTEERRQPPRKEFREDEDRDIAGIDRFAMLDRRETIFVRDVEKTPPPGWSSDRDYRTFIAASVATDTNTFGFLGVDASNAGDLSRADVEVVRQLAQILAIGLSISD